MVFYLILGSTYGFAAAVQPGPFQTYLVSQTLDNGWRRTFPAVFAPLLSDGPVVLLVLLVLSRVPGWLEQFLHILGGIFVLYLAYGAARTWQSYRKTKSPPEHPVRQSVLKAALVNLLNPNPYIGWSLVMGPLLMKGWRETPANGIALVGGFYTTMIVCTAGIMLLFAAARDLGPRVTRALIGVSALALGCFGLYQLWLGLFSR